MSEELHFRDRALIPVWAKVERGERLTLEDGLALYRTRDIPTLGKMAHHVQRRKSGDAVYYVVNQKIEHTNVCVLSCKFCDFAKKKGAPGAYEMTTDEILGLLAPEIAERVTAGTLEIVRSANLADLGWVGALGMYLAGFLSIRNLKYCLVR